MKEFKRVPLKIDVEFLPEGGFLPLRIIFNEIKYEIDRILKVKKYCPQVASCISPIEYTVYIGGIEKKIYYEEDTKSWFSIKEI